MSLVALEDEDVAVLLLRVLEDGLVDFHGHVQLLGGFYSDLLGVDVVAVLLEVCVLLRVVQEGFNQLVLIVPQSIFQAIQVWPEYADLLNQAQLTGYLLEPTLATGYQVHELYRLMTFP